MQSHGETLNVKLYVKIDKAAAKTQITIVSKDEEVLADSCSSMLNSGAFADFKISVTGHDGNRTGKKNFGASDSLVNKNATLPNGQLVCTRMHDGTEAFVNRWHQNQCLPAQRYSRKLCDGNPH